MTKQEAINIVNQSFPNFWTKEDVLQLINKINDTSEKNAEGLEKFAKIKLLDIIRDAVVSTIDTFDTNEIVDFGTAEFDLENNYQIVLSSVYINHSTITDEIMISIQNAIEEAIEN